MKRSLKSLIGSTIGATDGEIGKIKEFYFDDETWTIRYLIVETGSWFFGRKVLISPEALLPPDWEKKIFPVNLTIDQVENSPKIDTEKTVSRQHEIELNQHYSWTNYWGSSLYAVGMPLFMYQISRIENEKAPVKKIEGDQHLRSSDKVTGYNIKANNGEIGDVEDFLIDDKTWKVDFMIVDTGNWFPGKKVLISPKLIKEINWNSSSVIINATIDKIKNCPEYDADQTITDAYEMSLDDYYENSVL